MGLIVSLIIGGVVGWLASLVMKTGAQMGVIANIVVGIIGAFVGGFVTQRFFGDNLGNNGLVASFGVALLGSCIVIFVWKALSRARG